MEFQGFVFQDPNKKTNKDTEDADVSKLSVQFSQITAKDNDQSRLNDFKALRSPFETIETQEKRRRKALEFQKNRRNISISKARQLALGSKENDTEEEEEEDEENEEDVQTLKRKRGSDQDVVMHDTKLKKLEVTKKKNKKKNIYACVRDQIMYAETLEMLPENFKEDWIMMICPKGKRCLVTSYGGYTVARSRGGRIINKFQSRLPNGSRTNHSSEFCILDCVYDPVHWTFYVLDIMCWRGYPIYDCDTNFRYFWLQTKIEESELDRPNGENQFYKFVPLKPVLITDDLSDIIQQPREYINTQQQLDYDIDGLLFYHKEAHYKGGSTPLVCWVPFDNIPQLQQSL